MDDDPDLPEGWSRTTLGAVGEYLNGHAFKKTDWATAGRPIIRIQDLTGSNENPNYFTGELAERYVVRPGDLLISWSATLGAYIWQGREAVLNQHIFKVESRIDRRFHYHLVRASLDELQRNAHGSGMEHVTKGTFEALPVVIPDDPEVQRALAGVVDRADEQHALATEHLRSARRALEQFRQALLAAACSGRLTADWRDANGHTEDGATTLAAITAAKRARLGRRFKEPVVPEVDAPLPEGWVWTTLDAITDVATGATPRRSRAEYFGGDIPWVTSGAVNAGIIVEASEYITELAIEETNAKVFPKGTLLVAMYGEGQTRGRVAELGISAATNQAVAALLFDDISESVRSYLKVFLLENYERIRALSFGGVQTNLSVGVIKATPVPLPPVAEQVEVVERVRQLTELADGLVKRVDAAERLAGQASHSILDRVMRGQVAGPPSA
jgi:type I restriction enzyme S subunit